MSFLTRNAFGTSFGGAFLAIFVCLLIAALAYSGAILFNKREAIRRRLDRRPGLNSRSPIGGAMSAGAGSSSMTASMLDQAA